MLIQVRIYNVNWSIAKKEFIETFEISELSELDSGIENLLYELENKKPVSFEYELLTIPEKYEGFCKDYVLDHYKEFNTWPYDFTIFTDDGDYLCSNAVVNDVIEKHFL